MERERERERESGGNVRRIVKNLVKAQRGSAQLSSNIEKKQRAPPTRRLMKL